MKKMKQLILDDDESICLEMKTNDARKFAKNILKLCRISAKWKSPIYVHVCGERIVGVST